MRTIIITINILLLSLILYNLLSRGDKLLENLENCDAENRKQNALTAKINNQYNALDRIKKKKKEAKGILGASLFKILFSGQTSSKASSKLNKKKGEQMDKINEAGGEMDSVKSSSGAKYVEPDGKLGKALSAGPEQS
tara:strand:+ start:390 stop:803 length:414 start_codon:yes stop_codon:yes gene_type:complete